MEIDLHYFLLTNEYYAMTGNKHSFSFRSISAGILQTRSWFGKFLYRRNGAVHHCQNAFHDSAQQLKFATAAA